MPNIDIARLFHCIYAQGENIDWSSDIIINLLHRALITDQDFVNNISELLRKNNPKKSVPNSEVSKSIANRLLYFHSKSNYIKNGDIISVTHENGRVLLYGIVVTPDCDLDLLKTKYLEVVELEFLTSGRLGLKDDQLNLIRRYQFDSYFFLPSVLLNEKLEDFVAILKSKRIIEELPGSSIKKYPGSRTRFTFNSSHLYNNIEVKLNLICSITNPYKSEFLQKLHTNDSRVGIPDIKDLFN